MKKLFLFTLSFLPALTAAAQNVGIGTTTPQATLEVSGGSGEKALVSLSGTSSPYVSVQHQPHSITVTGSTTPFWQSFTAVDSGYLYAIELRQKESAGSSSATVSIYKGQGTGGALLGSVLLDIASTVNDHWRRTSVFDTPILIKGGETYTIHHSNPTLWYLDSENGYAGGMSSHALNVDYLFRVYTYYEREYFGVSGDDNPAAWAVYGDEFITGNSVISGRVGIGTATPQAPLHVVGTSDAITASKETRYFDSVTDVKKLDSWQGTTAGYFEGNVVSTISFIAASSASFSDERIKKIKGISDGAGDLETLKHIEIADYSMIDSVQHPGTYKKVIAQQVEQHLPQAVSLYSDYIPSVFAEARNVASDAASGLLKISLATPHQLKAGDELKLMTEKQGEQLVTVAAVSDALTFSVATSDHDWGKVFVYGKKVDDFRVVDYDAISMLNVSATQELARKVEQLEQEKRTLETRLEISEKNLGILRNDVEALKAISSQLSDGRYQLSDVSVDRTQTVEK